MNYFTKGSKKDNEYDTYYKTEKYTDPLLDDTFTTDNKLDKILDDINSIKEITIDMGHLLHQQNEKLVVLDENISNTDRNVQKANRELSKALKYKKGGRIVTATTAIGAMGGAFFGPIGAVSGAGIGLVGGSLYTLLI